jgi:ABC-2 type transport system ATP-binding protein
LLTFTSRSSLRAAAERLHDGVTANEAELTLQVPGDTSARSVLEVLSRIDPDSVAHISLQTPDLNDVFLALTGQTRKDQA